MADTFTPYNEMNRLMQGPESNVILYKDALDVFVCKIVYRVEKMPKGEFTTFPTPA